MAALLGMATNGCGLLLGVDDYRTAGPTPPVCDDSLRAGADCDQIVGVDECAVAFDADDQGGCVPQLPAARCGEGEAASPGVLQCLKFAENKCVGALAPTPDLRVEAGSEGSGDGSAENPYARIQDAIDAASPGQIIQVNAGTYPEFLRIEKPIVLRGACAATTRIVPPSGSSEPAITVTADGIVSLLTMGLLGGRGGILVHDPSQVELSGVWILDADGPGVSIDSENGSAEVSVGWGLLVERAMGAGIESRGGKLRLEDGLTVRGTRIAPTGFGGYGIALYPGRWGMTTSADAGAAADPVYDPVRADLILRSAIIEDNHGAGLLVEGSTATVSASVIRGVAPDDYGSGRGVEVRRRALGGVPASLTIEQSVISDYHDVGILVDDLPVMRFEERRATDPGVVVSIDRTTVLGPTPSDEACVGSGLRVRSAGAYENRSEAPVQVARSTIAGAREAAIHVQGCARAARTSPRPGHLCRSLRRRRLR